jgi:hypothetical protein
MLKVSERILQLDPAIKRVVVVDGSEPHSIIEEAAQAGFKGVLSKEERHDFYQAITPLLFGLANRYKDAMGTAVYGILHYEKLDLIFCKYSAGKTVLVRMMTNQVAKLVEMILREIGRS